MSLPRIAAGPALLLSVLALPGALATALSPSGAFTQAGSVQWWPIFFTVLGTGGVVAAAYVSIAASTATRTQRGKDKRKRTRIERPAPIRPRPAAQRAVVPARTLPATVEIRYPDIPQDFPDVWGAGEDLTVLVAAGDPEGGPAANGRVELTIGAEGGAAERIGLHANPEGLASVPRRYARPVDLKLHARLIRDDRTVAEGKRELRIVDYRQEIIETFGDFKRFAAERFPQLDAKATPREFVDRFYDQNARAPMRAMDRLAYVLELANYSDHPIDRSHYVEMVQAFLQLERAGVLGEGA